MIEEMKKAIVRFISVSICLAIAVFLSLFIFRSRTRKDAAYVYKVDPLITPELIEVTLPYLDGSGYLKGEYADVYVSMDPDSLFDTALAPQADRGVYAEDRDFRFSKDEARLSQVNVYYHINKMRDYFAERLGHSFDESIKCYVLHKPLRDPARYVPITRDIRFGSPVEGANPALNAMVIYREYARAVLDSIMPLNDEYESSAAGEAYACYFSCSLLGDPKYGERTSGFSGDAPGPKGFPMDKIGQRPAAGDLDNNRRYPEDLAYGKHGSFEILGGALWDIRKKLWWDAADTLIFEAYKRLGDAPDKYFFNATKTGGPYFSAVFQGLLSADLKLNNGANAQVIRGIFEKRGIPEEPYPYNKPQKFGSGIMIGWYPDDHDVFYALYWLGAYRIGEEGRLFGRMPFSCEDLALKLYDGKNELVDKFSTRIKISRGGDKGDKMFLAEFVIPDSVKPGEYRLQFDFVDTVTGSLQKSNAVSVIMIK